jgi:preprotein translocase subunit SecF/SecD/SecF fusion protein
MKLLNYYKYLFALSGIIMILGIVSLAIYGLRLGVDFKGGTITEIQFNQPIDQSKVRDIVAANGLQNFQLQTTDNNGLIIKTEVIEKEQHDKIVAEIRSQVGELIF